MNFLGARVAAGAGSGLRVALDAMPSGDAAGVLTIDAAAAPAERVVVGIRPEHVAIGPADGVSVPLTAEIERIEQLGPAAFLYCTLAGGERLTVHSPGQVALRRGERIAVHLPLAHTHVFDTAAGERALARNA
jgi:ABC-type sugar transport system ATPase subunit